MKEHMRIPVRVREGYEVCIGTGLLQESGRLLRAALGECRLAVVTDDNVARLYLPALLQSLGEAGLDACHFAFPAGEAHKRMNTLADMLEFFAGQRLTRGDAVVALGGGVTGDMAGFAAGCYLRGVRYAQIPTTLLAAVDASVGGKTAVDLSAGKNLAGLFHQPSLVLCDTDTFDTLPPGEFASGAAEAIKTGVLGDEALFSLLEAGDVRGDLADVVARCVSYKARIVEADEMETGMRKLLNLGHTAGHAIEHCSDFSVPHGHAVAIGLAMIARAAERRGWTEEAIAERIEAALQKNGLPIRTAFSPEALAQAALSDKKCAAERITLVVPRRIGACALMELPVEQLGGVFRAGMEESA